MTRVLSDAWSRRTAHDHPYRWLSTEPGELFDARVARELAASFPVDGFTRRDRADRARGKTYRNYSRQLFGPGTDAAAPPLPGLWQDLLDDVLSEEYRRRVATVLGQEQAAEVEVRLVRHAPGDWLEPHTDRDDKLFSHIVYFNAEWRPEWGGCLDILGGPDPASVVGSVVPRLGASALLAQAPNSWHQVARVSDGSAAARMSLLVHGLRP
ncbi:2OG-Fe(II) oxygenase family protein [Streptomyces sp. URMC 123]|uniref:2OG-Fe(II) oxygenase family protein n=1 Tax=Streptomyces sp. URMC 123 TaxID=3423403 RepID=UPI003F1BD13E